MTLWELPAKHVCKIDTLPMNMPKNLQARVHEIGLQPGRVVQCIRRGPFNGPILLALGGTVFALERELAKEIVIQAEPKSSH